MSTDQPTLTQVDPSQPRAFGSKIILAKGQPHTLDAAHTLLVNDLDFDVIVFTLHDNNALAELWGQPAGTSCQYGNGWNLYVNYIDNHDVVTGTRGMSQDYKYVWGVRTQGNSTLYFSKQSY